MPGRPIECYFRAACVACVLVSACSANQTDRSEPTEPQASFPDHVIKEAQQTPVVLNPTVSSRVGDVEVIVRVASPADVPEGAKSEWTPLIPHGVGNLAYGVLVPTVSAGTHIVAGILILPMSVYGYTHEKRVINSVSQALVETNLTERIQRALVARLSAPDLVHSIACETIEVIITKFGIPGTSPEQHSCLTMSVDLVLTHGRKEIKKENLDIESAIPPQCASLERFSEDDARLVKDSVGEYVEVLAAMIVEQLPRETPT